MTATETGLFSAPAARRVRWLARPPAQARHADRHRIKARDAIDATRTTVRSPSTSASMPPSTPGSRCGSGMRLPFHSFRGALRGTNPRFQSVGGRHRWLQPTSGV